MKKTGLLEHNRIAVAGVPQFSGRPAVLIPGALDWYGLYEEFLNGPGTDRGGHFAPTGWTMRHTGAASAVTVADLAGGAITFTGGAANNDTVQLTLGDAIIPGGGAFLVADGNDIYFEARIAAHSMTGETNIGIGLIDPAAADYLADDGAAPPNVGTLGLFTLDIGHAGPCPAHRWYSVGRKAAAEAYGDTGIAIVAATPITLGFHVSGNTPNYIADFYVNRVLIPAAQQVFANVPLTGLMPFIALKNGAVSETLTVDYVMCIQAR